MPATFLDQLLSTIAWTLVHSLWQGMILTILAGLVLQLTRQTSAALRYRALCTLFFFFLAGVGCTFLVEWKQATALVLPVDRAMAQTGTNSFLNLEPWRTGVAFFLDQNTTWIVFVWLLVLLFQMGRMLREVLSIRELRSCRTRAVEQFWRDRIQVLSVNLGIRRPVLLVESAVVKIPMVIGHIKPLVMVPLGLLNHLSPGEVEAVLLHELAHIRRHDYLVNYLQRVAEMLLFFNPGLLWLSSLLRAEREACCDELAIVYTGNKCQFVEALLRCKEQAMATPGLSLALFGKRNLLLHRLNRIVSSRNRSLSLSEASLFWISALLLSLVLSAWSQGTTAPVASVPVVSVDRPARKVMEQLVSQRPQEANKQLAVDIKTANPFRSDKRVKRQKSRQVQEVMVMIKTAEQRKPSRTNEPNQQIVVQLVDEQKFDHYDAREDLGRRRFQVDLERAKAEKARHLLEKDRAAAEAVRQQAAVERDRVIQQRQQAQLDRLRAESDRIEAQRRREQANHGRKLEGLQ